MLIVLLIVVAFICGITFCYYTSNKYVGIGEDKREISEHKKLLTKKERVKSVAINITYSYLAALTICLLVYKVDASLILFMLAFCVQIPILYLFGFTELFEDSVKEVK